MTKPKRPWRLKVLTEKGDRVTTYATKDAALAALDRAREQGLQGYVSSDDDVLNENFRRFGLGMLLRYLSRLRKQIKRLTAEVDAALEANKALREKEGIVTNDIVEIYRAANGEFRWRRRDPDNHAVLSGPQEGYLQKSYAEKAAHRSNSDIPDERFYDLTEDPPKPAEDFGGHDMTNDS